MRVAAVRQGGKCGQSQSRQKELVGSHPQKSVAWQTRILPVGSMWDPVQQPPSFDAVLEIIMVNAIKNGA